MNPLLQDFLLGALGGAVAWFLLRRFRRPIRFHRRRSNTDFKIETIMGLLYDESGVFNRLEKLEMMPDNVRIVTFYNRYLIELDKEIKAFCAHAELSIVHSSISCWATGEDVQDTLWYAIIHFKKIDRATER